MSVGIMPVPFDLVPAAATAWSQAAPAASAPEDDSLLQLSLDSLLDASFGASNAPELPPSASDRRERLGLADYKAAIVTSEQAGDWQRVVELFESMAAQGLEPTYACLRSSLTACEQAQQWGQAYRLLGLLSKQSPQLQSQMMTTPIVAGLPGDNSAAHPDHFGLPALVAEGASCSSSSPRMPSSPPHTAGCGASSPESVSAGEEDFFDCGVDPLQSRGRAQVKVPWSREDDFKILQGVRTFGHKWSLIAAELPSERSDDAVRNRWHRLQRKEERRSKQRGKQRGRNGPPPPPQPFDAHASTSDMDHLLERHGNKHGDMWTAEEDRTIDEGVRLRGLRWKAIAALLPGRTDSGCRNRWVRNHEKAFAAAGRQVQGAAAVFEALRAQGMIVDVPDSS